MQEDYAPRRQNRLFMQEIRRNGDADFLTAVRRNQQPNLPQERRRQRRRRRSAQGEGDVDEQLLQRGLAHQQAHGALELWQGAQQRLAFLKLLGGRGFGAHRRLRMVKAQGNAPDAQENPEARAMFLPNLRAAGDGGHEQQKQHQQGNPHGQSPPAKMIDEAPKTGYNSTILMNQGDCKDDWSDWRHGG